MFFVDLLRLSAIVIGSIVMLMWLMGTLGFADFVLLLELR